MSDKSTSTPQTPARGDDRNLVPADATGGATFEDRMLELWKKQRATILGTLVVLAGVLVGLSVFRMLQARREAEISAAFGRATTADEKRAFANEHSGHPLAGLALLAVADEAYRDMRYDDAARDYAAAARALEDPLFAGRARIGEAVSKYKGGQTAEGERLLTQLSEDTTVLLSHRAQALYELATFAAGAGDHAKALTAIDKLRALDPENYWAGRATALRTRLGADESPEDADAASLPDDGAGSTEPAVDAAIP
jgi:hypothetical protein